LELHGLYRVVFCVFSKTCIGERQKILNGENRGRGAGEFGAEPHPLFKWEGANFENNPPIFCVTKYFAVLFLEP